MSNSDMRQKSRKKKIISRAALTAICMVLLLFCGIGGTLAFLIDRTGPIKNIFTAATVKNEVEETFDGTEKSKIVVENTGDTPVYVRVKLISYRIKVDESGTETIVGGASEIPSFIAERGWFYDDTTKCYYYKKALEKTGDQTSDLLESSITLRKYEDGSKQVIEVLSEAIQAVPKTAVTDAWGYGVAMKLEDFTAETEASDEITVS